MRELLRKSNIIEQSEYVRGGIGGRCGVISGKARECVDEGQVTHLHSARQCLDADIGFDAVMGTLGSGLQHACPC